MENDDAEATWMTEQARISIDELATLSGLTDAALRELVEYGALVPVDPAESRWMFSAHCVVTLRTAGRLRNDFDLDPSAVALMLSFLERIRDLEEQLDHVRAQVPRRFT